MRSDGFFGEGARCDLTNIGGDSRFSWRCNLNGPNHRTANLGTFCIENGRLLFKLRSDLTGPAAQLHNCALRVVAFDKEKVIFLRKCQNVQAPKPSILTDNDRKFVVAHTSRYSISDLPAKPNLVIHDVDLTTVNGKDQFDKQREDGQLWITYRSPLLPVGLHCDNRPRRRYVCRPCRSMIPRQRGF